MGRSGKGGFPQFDLFLVFILVQTLNRPWLPVFPVVWFGGCNEMRCSESPTPALPNKHSENFQGLWLESPALLCLFGLVPLTVIAYLWNSPKLFLYPHWYSGNRCALLQRAVCTNLTPPSSPLELKYNQSFRLGFAFVPFFSFSPCTTFAQEEAQSVQQPHCHFESTCVNRARWLHYDAAPPWDCDISTATPLLFSLRCLILVGRKCSVAQGMW